MLPSRGTVPFGNEAKNEVESSEKLPDQDSNLD